MDKVPTAHPNHLRAPAPVDAQAQPLAANPPPPVSAQSWFVTNWLICLVCVLVLLLIFVIGWAFFRTPAPTQPTRAGPGPPKPQQEQQHAQPQQAQAQPQPQQTQAQAQQTQAQAQPAAAAPMDYDALLRRGNAVIAQARPEPPATIVRPDETSEEEIMKLMTEPAPTPTQATKKEEQAPAETDEKKL